RAPQSLPINSCRITLTSLMQTVGGRYKAAGMEGPIDFRIVCFPKTPLAEDCDRRKQGRRRRGRREHGDAPLRGRRFGADFYIPCPPAALPPSLDF
ncbi:hypothetical protein BHM03_00028064, partial [Ensete ventricosum]